MGARGAYPLQYVRGLVRTHIVHHDDIAWVEPGDEQGFDKGVEDSGCGGSFDGHHRPDTVQSDGPQHGGNGAPIPGDMPHHALPHRGARIGHQRQEETPQ